MRYKHKLYGIYDRETNLIFCGNLYECSEFLGITTKSFLSMVTRHKGNHKLSNAGYHAESIGKLDDFKIER